ncbi:MAG TPA: FAD-dependent oxidoreductase [Candidatus Lokiarchaeia archaeon]|nr:FAD-dependent oxidoreductase [Candidatus Lokiarchaeia archaeon]
MQDISCDALVIGAGPSGLSAAIYLKRANLDVLVIQGKILSALASAREIWNYAGLNGMKGSDLLATMTDHAISLGVNIMKDDVIGITGDMNPKMASTKTAVITAGTIIIATGKGTRRPVLSGEEKFIGLGVSYCATCDGPLYKHRRTVVIGMDDEAAEDVLILNQMGSDVTWVLKEKFLPDIDVVAEKLQEIQAKGITIIENARDLRLIGDDFVTGIEYTSKDGVQCTIETDCAFVISSILTGSLLKRAGLAMTDHGNIIVDKNQQTSMEGVFACGDACGNGFQVAIAVGEGAVASMSAAKYLRKLKAKD